MLTNGALEYEVDEDSVGDSIGIGDGAFDMRFGLDDGLDDGLDRGLSSGYGVLGDDGPGFEGGGVEVENNVEARKSMTWGWACKAGIFWWRLTDLESD